MNSPHSLSVERSVPGSIEKVFDAWLDPRLLAQWMTPGPGMSVPVAEIDPVVGGRSRIVMRQGDRDIPHEGEYRIIERPTRLVFTWTSEHAGADTLVSIQFTRVTANETNVALTHERFPNQAIRDSHRNGWSAILDALARTMSLE
jgi:uncharacterized protein YndB with AHSA1/START domain